jgi:hypothetical protein
LRRGPAFWPASFTFALAPDFVVLKDFVFGDALGGHNLLHLRGGLAESFALGVGAVAAGGDVIADGVAVARDGQGRVGLEQIAGELIAKLPDSDSASCH